MQLQIPNNKFNAGSFQPFEEKFAYEHSEHLKNVSASITHSLMLRR